jgi:hypothetical protein
VLESGWTNGSAPRSPPSAEWLKDGKSLKLGKKDSARLEALLDA